MSPLLGSVFYQWHYDQLEFVRDIAILPFRDLGWEIPILANFGGFGEIYSPKIIMSSF